MKLKLQIVPLHNACRDGTRNSKGVSLEGYFRKLRRSYKISGKVKNQYLIPQILTSGLDLAKLKTATKRKTRTSAAFLRTEGCAKKSLTFRHSFLSSQADLNLCYDSIMQLSKISNENF